MNSSDLRQNVLAGAKRVVVKVGTRLVTGLGRAQAHDNGPSGRAGVDTAFIRRIARQTAKLREAGHEITLVSSGAVGAGCVDLGLDQPPSDVARQQAVAAVGQRGLTTHWHRALSRHGLEVGQMLLTRADFDDRTRYLNIRNCVAQLHDLGCVALLNENDAVAVEELRFGDNDMLAAMTANALPADALILLTDTPGLLDHEGGVIDQVDQAAHALDQARRDDSTHSPVSWSTGGIRTKLESARLVTEAGETAVIASGHERNILPRLLQGEMLGTIFAPATRKLEARKRWIGLTARPAGTLTVDDGAAAALRDHGKSLLASGITAMTGRFNRGDVLLVRDSRGRELARGLTNYEAQELSRIRGRRTEDFDQLLSRATYREVIHRDNLVLRTSGQVSAIADL